MPVYWHQLACSKRSFDRAEAAVVARRDSQKIIKEAIVALLTKYSTPSYLSRWSLEMHAFIN